MKIVYKVILSHLKWQNTEMGASGPLVTMTNENVVRVTTQYKSRHNGCNGEKHCGI